MDPTSPRWKEITPSEFPWELEALQFVRAGLPDYEPYRAWSNFTFIARDGTLNEVDLLVASPTGVFLVEIKSRPGELTGDAGTWIWTGDGRRYTDDNPILLADKKCKRLKTLLAAQAAAKKIRLPFIAPLVFCSDKDLKNRLPDHARHGVFLRDRDKTPEHGPRRGIIWALTEWPPELDDETRQRRRLDRPTIKAVARALEEAGIAPSQRSRRVGDYLRGELLFEGPGYQDWSGRHVSLENVNRRIRIYTYGRAASPAERETIRRAAQREFQILEGISHRGILRANDFRDLDHGAAVIFDRDPNAVRLDHYIRQHGQRLSLRERLSLLRQIAEALQYAHDKKVTHRALSPQSILVRNPDASEPDLEIFNWQTAAREIRSTGPTRDRFTATAHLEQLIEDASTVYVAPEALTSDHATGEQLDVFSLGALAYFLFTGEPPATGPSDLQQKLRDGHGLQLSAILDGSPRALQDMIQAATAPAVIDRLDSVEDFLVYLADAEKELIAPAPDTVTNIIEARTGDSLGNGIVVEKRLGRGSTAVAYLVTWEGNEYVLKVAINPEHNDRLKDEADVLTKLRDRHIVEVVRVEKIGDHLGILMKLAGEKTLARRLREEGRLELELLERFGEQLLRTVDFLEQQGIPHRDIKPENIGVRQSGHGSRLELVLFDFSLSRTPVEQIEAGTRPYLDPFLADRKPRRWDTYAERYAAAVTLYEMTTGTLPAWGDGLSNPAVLDCQVTLDPELFDASVRDDMTAFFEKALRRDHAQRFDNAEDMLKAWRHIFQLTERHDHDDSDADTDDATAHLRLDHVTSVTPLSEIGLSTRALNALERRGAQRAGDLLRLTMAHITRTPGIGTKTRREIAALLRQLRMLLSTEQEPTDGGTTLPRPIEPPPPGDATIYGVEHLAALLIPTRTGSGDDPSRRQLEVFLGLTTDSTQGWPSQTDAAEVLGVTRARIGQVVAKARERWAKHSALNALRDDIATLLSENGGVTPAIELSRAVLALRGSTEDEPRRSILASAVTRAAIEAERTRQIPRWITRRRGPRVLIAADDPAAGVDGQSLADYAEALGRAADLLAVTNPLPPPNRAIEALRAVRAPPMASALSDDRLLRLATAASEAAALSSRLEIYPRAMPADRAVKLAQGALLGARELSVEQIRQRVLGRYPEAAPLPDRPRLDTLIGSLACDLEWDSTAADGRGAYRARSFDVGRITSGPTSLTRYPTADAAAAESDPEREQARAFEDRLARAARAGGFLALTTTTRHAERVADEIGRRFPLMRCDLDEMLIRHMKATVENMRARWDVVLKADLDGPVGPDWGKLLSVVGRALPAVELEVKASGGPVLLCHPGLLARYSKLDLIERLREATNRGEGLPGLWVLIPSDEQHPMPVLDGVAVPVITPAQWARIPEPWIENRHRGQPT